MPCDLQTLFEKITEICKTHTSDEKEKAVDLIRDELTDFYDHEADVLGVVRIDGYIAHYLSGRMRLDDCTNYIMDTLRDTKYL